MRFQIELEFVQCLGNPNYLNCEKYFYLILKFYNYFNCLFNCQIWPKEDISKKKISLIISNIFSTGKDLNMQSI